MTRVVLIDSFSTDATVDDRASATAPRSSQHPFKNHADQFRWGLAAAAPTTDWVMRIDCDEYFEDSALGGARRVAADAAARRHRRQRQAQADLPRADGSVTAAIIPSILLRLWRNGAAEMEQRWMDEHMVLTRGRAVLLEGGDLVDHNLAGLDAWTAKHNRYATLAMVDAINREYPLFEEDRRIEDDDERGAAQPLPEELRLRPRAALSARAAAVSLSLCVPARLPRRPHRLRVSCPAWLLGVPADRRQDRRGARFHPRPRPGGVQTTAARASGSSYERRPVVLVALGCFWPGNDASGPNQSFIALATALATRVRFPRRRARPRARARRRRRRRAAGSISALRRRAISTSAASARAACAGCCARRRTTCCGSTASTTASSRCRRWSAARLSAPRRRRSFCRRAASSAPARSR